ncbi:MAG: Mov34/MPN/PAD-1 family protein [Syntrophales bacterium]|jgi:integrative and conjugative element protein (TIGR02256 family)
MRTTVATFVRRDGSKIKLDSDPYAIMKGYRQIRLNDKEAGGILLGRMIENSNDVIIDEITVPGLLDKRNRFSFIRSKFVQSIIFKKWRTSKHTKNYLGEWHTHPESQPSPSGTDLKDWANILRKGRFEQNYLIFIIVGQVMISAWEFHKDDSEPYLLHLQDQP